MFIPDQTELAWAAGFFDGEGTTCVSGYTIKLSITQAGEYAVASLTRFSNAVGGLGAIGGPYEHKPGPNGKPRKPMYYLNITGFEKVQAVIAMLWKYLGTQKKLQAAEAIKKKSGLSVRVEPDYSKLMALKPVQHRRPRITKETIEEIQAAWRSGVNLKTICERFSVSKFGARSHLKGIEGGYNVFCYNGHRRTKENTHVYVSLKKGKECPYRVCADCAKAAHERGRKKVETLGVAHASIQT